MRVRGGDRDGVLLLRGVAVDGGAGARQAVDGVVAEGRGRAEALLGAGGADQKPVVALERDNNI